MILKFRDFIRVKKQVNQVPGQFAQYNEPKWKLIILKPITKLQSHSALAAIRRSANYLRRGSNGLNKII